MFIRFVALVCVIGFVGCSHAGDRSDNRVLALAELSSASLAALDPMRTAFILETAPLEEHGPHLPIAADTYQGDDSAHAMAQQMAEALPGWKIVLMPPLWYGIDGANRIPERYDIRGTLSLRPSTLRALAIDLGNGLADQGFQWLFLVHIHGAPLEHAALSDAADFVRETRGMGMYNVGSIDYNAPNASVEAAIAARFSASDRSRIGFDLHAGFSETSNMLAARPDLVSNNFRTLPDVTVRNWDELLAAGKRPQWQGYWSAPALADAEIGRLLLDAWATRWTHFALKAITGENLSRLPRFPDGSSDDPAMRMSVRTVNRQHDLDAQFGAWIARRDSILDR